MVEGGGEGRGIVSEEFPNAEQLCEGVMVGKAWYWPTVSASASDMWWLGGRGMCCAGSLLGVEGEGGEMMGYVRVCVLEALGPVTGLGRMRHGYRVHVEHFVQGMMHVSVWL